jgi:putative transposase
MIATLHQLSNQRAKHGLSMELFYQFAGITRQGFFQASQRLSAYTARDKEIIDLVIAYRRHEDARAGSRQLYYNLNIKARFDIGVTKFEQILSKLKLALKQLRVRIVTTKSTVASWSYGNQTNGIVLKGINQLIVGDLTYIDYWPNRYYLFCLKDVYSSRIVGFSISTRMRAKDAVKALNMVVKLRGKQALNGCIHHTDGGSQYFSDLYRSQMNDLRLKISRAENCLQNGYAEQLNGLIKNHLVPVIPPKQMHFPRAIARLMKRYNEERKQEQLGWMSPVEFEASLKNRKEVPKVILHNFEE